jgi:PKD repeat protein
MYGNYSISPNPIQQGEPLNVTVDLANYGFDNFNGDLYLGLFDQNTGDWVEDIEQLSSEYQSSQTHDTYNFSSTNVTLSPGNYLLCLFYRKTGSSCWIRVPQMLYINPLSVQVTSSPLIANFIASSTSICSGNPVQFTDQSTGNPTSWLWNFGDGYTSTSQSPSHTYNTSGTYTVSLTITKGANNDTETKTNYITVLPLPSIANTPTGTTILCQDATNTSYNTTGATNATSYFWSISPAGVGTISGTGTTATVDWNSTFSGSASINVRGVNSCGNGAWSNTFVVNINPIPSTASTPTGLADLCQNASNTNYTTSGASSATTYEWSITPTGAGTISGTGTTGTVDWNNTYTGSVSIKVRGVNSCGNGQWSNVLAVNINLIPAISPAPIGSTTLCQNASNTVYSTTGTTYSTSYEWSISPSGAGAISGSGLTGSVDWISTFVGTATIKVRGVNSCGNGAWSNTLTVTVNPLPSDAIFPTGSSLLCQNASNTSYNTSGASNATSYLWSIDPSSAGVISGNGTTGIVDWNSSFLGTATIYVTGVNSCGNSLTASSITVIVNPIPTTAATPTGSTSLCQNASNTDYLSAGGTYTSSYVWGINPPSAGMITGNGLIGTVDWNNSFSGSAAITVYGINNCGNGSMSAPLNITINSLPAQPTISNNGNQLTSSASSNYQWYHNASLISGAITHTYTAFHNGSYWVSVSNIYGCSSTSIPFNYYIPSSLPFSPELLTTSGNVDINGNTILSWSIGESIIEINTNTNNILTQGFHQSDYLVTEIDKKEDPNYLIKIFPNPSSDNVTIEITTNIPDVFNLILIDEQGRSLLFQKMSSIEKTKSINLGKYSSGIYILKINSETNKISKSYKIQKIN